MLPDLAQSLTNKSIPSYFSKSNNSKIYSLLISLLTFSIFFLPQIFQWVYVLLPILIIRKLSIYKSLNSKFVAIFFFLGVFNICASTLFSHTHFFPSVLSFLVSLFPLLPLLCPFDSKVFRAISHGVCLYAVFWSFTSLYQAYSLGPLNLFILKAEVGSQRIAPILFFAIFYLYDFLNTNLKYRRHVYLLFYLVLIGLFLTFSRSSFLALLSLPIAFSRNSIRSLLVDLKLSFSLVGFLRPFVLFVFSFLISTIFLSVFFPDALAGLVGLFDVSLIDFSSYNSSEGFRVYLWVVSLQYLFDHIFWGTAFNGCMFLIGDSSCSYHSQYIDTFVRFGFPLSFLSLCLAILVLRRSLFVPSLFPFGFFVATSLSGLFHETYRYPSLALPFSLVLWYLLSNTPFSDSRSSAPSTSPESSGLF